jgi:hypothetical protein
MADKPITRLASEMAAKEQKKKRGFFDKIGGFLADAGQEVGRIVTNPVETVQRLGSEAKSTFFDPIRDLPNAFDPTSGLSPMERVTTGVGGGLAVADALTPFMPEGALANAMVKRAANRTLAETGTTSFAKSGPINIMGIEVPYGPEAARYAAKLKRLDESMGVAPGKGVASIGMNVDDAAEVAAAGIYDPILGKAGTIQEAGDNYVAKRNLIEAYTKNPVYGYQRYPADLTTASEYRGNYVYDGAIFNVDPSVPRLMSQGDSMYLYDQKTRANSTQELIDSIFSPYDPNIAPPRPGFIGEDLADAAVENKTISGFMPSYREVQMGPVDIARDVNSLMLPRPLGGMETAEQIANRRAYAESMAKAGIPITTGRTDFLKDILANDIKNGAYPPELLAQMKHTVSLIPDPVPLNRLPSRWVKPYKKPPYREGFDF